MAARFVGTLSVSPYPDGKTWYLNRALVYKGTLGEVRIPRGFETDFASVPTLVTNIFPRWGTYGPASVVHDWLYWNQHTTRKEADDTFLEAMVVLEVSRLTRWALHTAVRAFGQFAWEDNALIALQGFSRVRTAASPPVPAWSRTALKLPPPGDVGGGAGFQSRQSEGSIPSAGSKESPMN